MEEVLYTSINRVKNIATSWESSADADFITVCCSGTRAELKCITRCGSCPFVASAQIALTNNTN